MNPGPRSPRWDLQGIGDLSGGHAVGVGKHERCAHLRRECGDDRLHVSPELVSTKVRFGRGERARQRGRGGDHERTAALEMLKSQPCGDGKHPGRELGRSGRIKAADRGRDPQHRFLREVFDGCGVAGGPEKTGEQGEHGPGVVVDQPPQCDWITALRVSQGLCTELRPAGVALGVGSHRPLTSRTLARVPAGADKSGGDGSQ